ncbi:MAG: hypothetical protein IIA72_11340 [Proteobacteria bacterium]|nr:hypothetical protein [Pseudomonadota bacterium]
MRLFKKSFMKLLRVVRRKAYSDELTKPVNAIVDGRTDSHQVVLHDIDARDDIAEATARTTSKTPVATSKIVAAQSKQRTNGGPGNRPTKP